MSGREWPPDDLSQLERLDRESLLNALVQRYQNGQFYTYIGDVTIAVNPYRKPKIYDQKHHERYADISMRTDQPPHIFWVADKAHQRIQRTRTNQTILVSGESGSGKTENSKRIIQHIAHTCNSPHANLHLKIVEVNPLLEAFGNAVTPLNKNSSRFGKFVELHFTQEGILTGAEIFDYLMEKSRVVRGPPDINFHYFYSFLAGVPEDKRHIFGLSDPNLFKIAFVSDERDRKIFADQFNALENIMESIGLSREDRLFLMTVVASVLHIANLEFEEDTNGHSDSVHIINDTHLDHAARLLHIDVEELSLGLLKQRISAGPGGEKIVRGRGPQEARDCRDALAKALYQRLFGWLVGRVNQHLQPEGKPREMRSIAILDMAGFESFQNNGLDQLLINAANERLQYYFNDHLFAQEQREINWTDLHYENNIKILDLLLGNRITHRLGVLSMIDEETRTPRSSDLVLVRRFHKEFLNNKHYVRTSQGDLPCFAIEHFAGRVKYNAVGFLDTNRDTLSEELVEVIGSSTVELVAKLFSLTPSNTGTISKAELTERPPLPSLFGSSSSLSGKSKPTVIKHFKNSLSELVEKLCRSEPLFVRCIKPNNQKDANKIETSLIVTQLEYNGLLELAKIRKIGFPIRLTKEVFIERYKLLVTNQYGWQDRHSLSERCEKVLKAVSIKDAQVDTDKIFLKEWHRDVLDGKLLELHGQASVIQKHFKGYQTREKFRSVVKKASLRESSPENKPQLVDSVSMQNIARQAGLENGRSPMTSDSSGIHSATESMVTDESKSDKRDETPDEDILPSDAWNIFRLIPRERVSSSESFGTILRVTKGVLYVILFLMCIGGLVVSKVCLLLLTTSYQYVRDAAKMDQAKMAHRNTMITVLIICLSVPNAMIFIVHTFKGLFGSQPWPGILQLLKILLVETLQTGAKCALVFLVLPQLDMVRGALSLSTVCLIPSLFKLLSGLPPSSDHRSSPSLSNTVSDDQKKKSKCVDLTPGARAAFWYIFNFLAMLAQLGAIGSFAANGNYHHQSISNSSNSPGYGMVNNTAYRDPGLVVPVFQNRWLFPLVIVLLSLTWWDNFIEKNLKCCDAKVEIPFRRWKVAIHSYRQKSSIITSLWNIGIVIAFPYIFIDSFQFALTVNRRRDTGLSQMMITFAPAFGQIGGAFLAYVASVLSCKLKMQLFCFSVPILLSTPLTVAGIILQSHFHFIPKFGEYFLWYTTEGFGHTPLSVVSYWQFALMGVFWISAMIIGGHIWAPKQSPMDSTEKLFVRPLYCGISIEQDLMLNRRRRDTEIHYSKVTDLLYFPDTPETESLESHSADSTYAKPEGVEFDEDTPSIFACATMWHETKNEMTQLMKSLFRMDKDVSKRKNLMTEDNTLKDKDYFHFETHIMFDDAMDLNDVEEPILNGYVTQFISTLDEAASSVHNCEIKVLPPTRTVTPYGGRLTWTLPGGTLMVVHLKDKSKIRHKKRWSQIMYMYYLLGYRLLGLDDDDMQGGTVLQDAKGNRPKNSQFISGSIFKYLPPNTGRKADNTFILALDGDVDFKPAAVRLLLDGMKTNRKNAAVCGRIHPVGSGPVVWYQIFEYAVGHWLQKAAEHVYGCVLCCPGCFSLFRASALMDDNVMRQYSVKAETPMNLVQYDQGEDRWLSTLLIQQGYLVQYNAAADALTYAPETFHEFFNQRRRWITSTMANLLDLLGSYKSTVAKNDNVSYLYMFYQFVMFIASILTPGTIVLMIAGSYNAVIGTDMLQSFLLAVTPIIFFVLVCFTTKPDTHIIVAQFLTAIYAIVMTMVLVGNFVNIAMESVVSPSGIFVILLLVIFVTSAILHPQEFFSLPPGLLYVIIIPTGLLLVILYSLCNTHVISWGTREGVKKKTTEERNREEREKEEKRRRDIAKQQNRGLLKWFGLENFWRDIKTFILTIVNRGAGTNNPLTSQPRESESALAKLQGSIDTLNSNLEGRSSVSVHHLDPQDNELRRMLKAKKSRPSGQIHFDRGLKVGKVSDSAAQKGYRNEEVNNPCWMYESNVSGGSVVTLSAREAAFWRQIIHILLHPIEKNPVKEQEIGAQLRQMRTNITFAFLMCNFLFVLTIFQLQLLKEALADQFFIEVARTDFPDETLELEPLSLSFMGLFGLMLFLQFTATLIHRFITFLHIMSRTEMWGVKNEYNQLLELADQLQSINASSLDNEFEIPEPDYDQEDNRDPSRRESRSPNSSLTGSDGSNRIFDSGNAQNSIPANNQRVLPPPPSGRQFDRRDRPSRNRFYKSRYLAPIRVNPDMLSRNFQRRLGHLRNHVRRNGRPSPGMRDVEMGDNRPRDPRNGVTMTDIFRTVRGHRGLNPPNGFPLSTGRYQRHQPRRGYLQEIV